MGAATASPAAFLQAIRISGSTPVLVNSSHHTLYLLSSERSGHLHCTGACLTYWPPLLVKKSTARVTLGPGVKGRIGFIVRSKTMKQVTFNSYPLYRFAGDAGPAKANGEGLVSYGGTWYAIAAGARTPNATPVKALVTKPTGTGGY